MNFLHDESSSPPYLKTQDIFLGLFFLGRLLDVQEFRREFESRRGLRGLPVGRRRLRLVALVLRRQAARLRLRNGRQRGEPRTLAFARITRITRIALRLLLLLFLDGWGGLLLTPSRRRGRGRGALQGGRSGQRRPSGGLGAHGQVRGEGVGGVVLRGQVI